MLPDAAVMWIPCDLLRTTCLPHAEILRRTPTHTRTHERVGPAPAPTHATQDASHQWDIMQPWDAQQWHTHGRPALVWVDLVCTEGWVCARRDGDAHAGARRDGIPHELPSALVVAVHAAPLPSDPPPTEPSSHLPASTLRPLPLRLLRVYAEPPCR